MANNNQILNVPDWYKYSSYTFSSTLQPGFSQLYPGPDSKYWYVRDGDTGLVYRVALDYQFGNGFDLNSGNTDSFVNYRVDINAGSGLTFSYSGINSQLIVAGLTAGNLNIAGGYTAGYSLSLLDVATGQFVWIPTGSASVSGTSGSIAKFTTPGSVGDSIMREESNLLVVGTTPISASPSLTPGISTNKLHVGDTIYFNDNTNKFLNGSTGEFRTSQNFKVSTYPLLPGTTSLGSFIDAQTDTSTWSTTTFSESPGYDKKIEFLSGLVSMNQRSGYPALFVEPTPVNTQGLTPEGSLRTPIFTQSAFLNKITGTFGVALGLSGGGLQIRDGFEGLYKVLVSSTTQGHALWANMVDPGPRWRLPLYQNNGDFNLGASQGWVDSYNWPIGPLGTIAGGPSSYTPIVRTFSASIDLTQQNWSPYVRSAPDYNVRITIPNVGGPTGSFLLNRNRKDIFGGVYLYDEVESFGAVDTTGKVDSGERFNGATQTQIGNVPGLYYLRNEGVPSSLLRSGTFFKDISNTSVVPDFAFTVGKTRRNNAIRYGLAPEKLDGNAWNYRNQQIISGWNFPIGARANVYRPNTWTSSYYVGAVGAGGATAWTLPDGSTGSGSRNAWLYTDSLQYLAFSQYNFFPRTVVQDSLFFIMNATQGFPYRSLMDEESGDRLLSWGQPGGALLSGTGPNSVSKVNATTYTGVGYGHDMFLARYKSTVLGQDFMADRARNFLMDYQTSRIVNTASYTEMDTILHKMIKGESGEYNANITQSTALFVTNQIGSWQDSGAFVTASRMVGIQVAQTLGIQYRKPNAWAKEAYDFYSSRIGNGNTESNIESHVGFFAQSKLNGQMWDPMGRRFYAYGVTPYLRNPADQNLTGLGQIAWPTYSIYNVNKPWAFFAEKDKSNLGGGLLIDMGATFGTPLRAYLEIEAVTQSAANRPFTVSSTISVFQRDGSYITYPYTGLSYSTYSQTYPQILLRPGVTPSFQSDGSLWYTPGNLSFRDGGNTYNLLSMSGSVFNISGGGVTGSGTNDYVPVWSGPESLKGTSSIRISNGGDGNVGIGLNTYADYALQVATTSLSPKVSIGISGSILYQDGSNGQTGSVMMTDADGKTYLYNLVLPAPGLTIATPQSSFDLVPRKGPTMGSGYLPLYVGKGNNNGPSGSSEYQLGPSIQNRNGSLTSVLLADQPFNMVITIPTVDGAITQTPQIVLNQGAQSIFGRKTFREKLQINIDDINNAAQKNMILGLEPFNPLGTFHNLRYNGGSRPFHRQNLNTPDYGRSILMAVNGSPGLNNRSSYYFYSSAAFSDTLSSDVGAYFNQRVQNGVLRNQFASIDGQIGRYTESIMANNTKRGISQIFIQVLGGNQFWVYGFETEQPSYQITPTTTAGLSGSSVAIGVFTGDVFGLSSTYSFVEVDLATYNQTQSTPSLIGGTSWSPGYDEKTGLTAGIHYFVSVPPVTKFRVQVTDIASTNIPNFVGEFDFTRIASTSSNSNRLNTYIGTYKRMELGYNVVNSSSNFVAGSVDVAQANLVNGYATSSIRLMTGLFINNQIGGFTWSYSSATYSIGVYSRQDVDSGNIKYAYDFFSSRMSATDSFSRIDNHVGFYAQSKTIGTLSMDPTGRNQYDFSNPIRYTWPLTFSYGWKDSNNGPWSFFAESDKAGFGGGALLMGTNSSIVRATTTSNPNFLDVLSVYKQGLPSWLVIQESTQDKSQLRLIASETKAKSTIKINTPLTIGSQMRLYTNYPTSNTTIVATYSVAGVGMTAQAAEIAGQINISSSGYTASSFGLTISVTAPNWKGSTINSSTISTTIGSANITVTPFSGGIDGVYPSTTYDGDLWFTGTALNFQANGITYDLLTSGGGGGGGAGPQGPRGFQGDMGPGGGIGSQGNQGWQGPTGSQGATGISSVGAFNKNLYAYGATLSAGVLTMGAASTTTPGLVHTDTQTFSGDKSFLGDVYIGPTNTNGIFLFDGFGKTYSGFVGPTGIPSNLIYRLPSEVTVGRYLKVVNQNGGNYELSWATAAGGGPGGSLPSKEIGFGDGSAIVSNSNFCFDSSNCDFIASSIPNNVNSSGMNTIIGGSCHNLTSNTRSVILGGICGSITASNDSIILGASGSIGACDGASNLRWNAILLGENNRIFATASNFNTIINGCRNSITQQCNNITSIIGGSRNNIYRWSSNSFILGGDCDSIFRSECSAVISAVSSCVWRTNSDTLGVTISTTNKFNVILNGQFNFIIGSGSSFNTVVGGFRNCVVGESTTSGGVFAGNCNAIGGTSSATVLLGGTFNDVSNSIESSIIGGCNNTINNSSCSLITTSRASCICSGSSTGSTIKSGIIIGGDNNQIIGSGSNFASIINGNNQSILGTNSNNSSILGGISNEINRFSETSTIIGGDNNTIFHAKCSAIISSRNSSICLNSNATSADTLESSIIIGGLTNVIFGTSSTFTTILNGNNQCILGCGSNNSAIIAGDSHLIGTNSNNSVIIGGSGHKLGTSSNSVILGGSGLVLNNTSNTVLVSKLMINDVPQSEGQNQVMMWNSTDKKVYWKNQWTGGPAGGGVTISGIDLNGLQFGATISSGYFTFGAATDIYPGIVVPQSQTFSGDKEFRGSIYLGLTSKGVFFYDKDRSSYSGFVGPDTNWSKNQVYQLPQNTGTFGNMLSITSILDGQNTTTYSLTWSTPKVGSGLTVSLGGTISLTNLTPNTTINLPGTYSGSYSVTLLDNQKLFEVTTGNTYYTVFPPLTQSISANSDYAGFEFRVIKKDQSLGAVTIPVRQFDGPAPYFLLTRQNQIAAFKYNPTTLNWSGYMIDNGYIAPNTLMGNFGTTYSYERDYEVIDYRDGTQKALNFSEGAFAQDFLSGVIYSSIDPILQVLTTPTTQYELINVGSNQYVGTNSIPAFALTRGKMLRIKLSGTYSNQNTTYNTTNFILKMSSFTLSSFTYGLAGGLTSSSSFDIEYDLKVRYGGQSGSIYVAGKYIFDESKSPGAAVYAIHTPQSNFVDINLTQVNNLQIWAQNSSGVSNPNITVNNSIIERLT